MSASTGKDEAAKMKKKKFKFALIFLGGCIVTAAFIAGFHLTFVTYGQMRYTQGVRDTFLNMQQFSQQEPCRKATIRELTLEKDPMYQ